jgi:hypothetical protein
MVAEEDVMTELQVDALTRRTSVFGLGAGMLALAGPLAASAKNTKSKKIKKKARKKCQSQVGQCEAEVREVCGDDQTCVDAQLRCCPTLATCNLFSFFACLTTPG